MTSRPSRARLGALVVHLPSSPAPARGAARRVRWDGSPPPAPGSRLLLEWGWVEVVSVEEAPCPPGNGPLRLGCSVVLRRLTEAEEAVVGVLRA